MRLVAPLHARQAVLAALVTSTIALAQPLGATAATAGPSTVLHTYAPTAEPVANPERGFYHYTEAHFTTDGTGFTPLDAAALAKARTEQGVTLVFRYYYLDAYRTQDTISVTDLARVAADLDAVRSAGVKIVLRFAYSDSSGDDAPVERVVRHITQIAPVLNASSDVVEALQAGFVGRWGEWYYTDHFATDPSTPWALSDADWANRRTVLLALLDATSTRIRVQVRYPAIKQHILPDPADRRAARVGVHDDCFLAGDDDSGTFASDADRAWLEAQSTSTVVGGETCAESGDRSLWPSASTDLATYHWTFLNADFHSGVLESWGEAGRSEAARRLGYRIRLTSATLPSRARPGSTVAVRLTLANDGYAAPVQNRPVRLVLRGGGSVHVVRLKADTRTWAPGRTVRLTARVRVPVEAGEYGLHLDLPDSSARLRTSAQTAGGDTTHAAYAVRLANSGTWDASTGWNDLGQVLTVAP